MKTINARLASGIACALVAATAAANASPYVVTLEQVGVRCCRDGQRRNQFGRLPRLVPHFNRLRSHSGES